VSARRTFAGRLGRAGAVLAVLAACLLVLTGGAPTAQPVPGFGPDRPATALQPAATDAAATPQPSALEAGPAISQPSSDISVTLRDDGASATVSWRLGTPAAVVLAMTDGAGNLRRVVTMVPASQTSFVLRGLDPRQNFCVVVGPVDAAAAVTRTVSACTSRR
jgi:hypothetical protein